MPGAVTPSSIPLQGGGNLTPIQIGNLWLEAGGPISELPTAIAVALAESGGSTRAHNPSGASGLWQLMPFNQHGNPYNPLQNARDAVRVFKSSGWGAWSTYTGGQYHKYYPQAVTVADTIKTSPLAEAIQSGLVVFGPFAGAAALDAAGGAAAGEAGAAGTGGGLAGGLARGVASGALSNVRRDLGIAALVSVFLDPKHWQRILLVVLGVVGIGIGVVYMVKSQELKGV